MEIMFDEQELKKVEEIKSRYPHSQAALMGVLWLAQKKFGWISKEVVEYVAKLLDLPPSHVDGVVSFYTMYFKKPMGKYHIQVCTNVSCLLRGGEEIYHHLCEKLGIGNGEVTPDGLFSIEEVECMGACGGAPMIAINEDYFENLDITFVDNLIEKLKNGNGVSL
ncbi:MAG: NADH-quinone oxidoreductase subunit NuoE [Candidatus Kapaibacteriota bacterium]|jgi:NADH-quinone oxidoreductase E subunit